MNTKTAYSRRHLLKRGVLASTALWSGRRILGANDDIRVAIIGLGGKGSSHVKQFSNLPGVRLVALCDVDPQRLAKQVKRVDGAHSQTDPRRILDRQDIDAVVIATPDHWHAPACIWACEAGKDVYVETPASHNLAEGERMVQAGRLWNRVIQTGMHQRSGAHFQSAIEFLRSGKLGPVNTAKAWIVHRRKSIGFKANAPIPKEVDYDMWLGPARKQPFNPNRFHANWHWFWDYGTGEIGNWGVHLLDIARWGLDVELPQR
ncbi:MAG: Gfo/Idh/MocA family oxidoreductase, partial [Planctomycetes bacterium]|nr:Gfo/Idh/MocA family oxidoreductase [Planctomycetota bacterium]